jgi:hypothetical protein
MPALPPALFYRQMDSGDRLSPDTFHVLCPLPEDVTCLCYGLSVDGFFFYP